MCNSMPWFRVIGLRKLMFVWKKVVSNVTPWADISNCLETNIVSDTTSVISQHHDNVIIKISQVFKV